MRPFPWVWLWLAGDLELWFFVLPLLSRLPSLLGVVRPRKAPLLTPEEEDDWVLMELLALLELLETMALTELLELQVLLVLVEMVVEQVLVLLELLEIPQVIILVELEVEELEGLPAMRLLELLVLVN